MAGAEIFAQHYSEDLHGLYTLDILDGLRRFKCYSSVDEQQYSLDLVVLRRKLLTRVHEEICSNSAETVERADAGTIRYVSSAYLTIELVWFRACRSGATMS